jgi:hypothetical protein
MYAKACADAGVPVPDYYVSHLAALVPTEYIDVGMTCPHGITWHMEPHERADRRLGQRRRRMSGRTDNAAQDREVPENRKAPCNICGRGWPYHHDACAYKQTAIEAKRYRSALEQIAAAPEWWQGKLAQEALFRV